MKAERWQQVEQLYHAALEREPESRAAFLDEACAGDAVLRGEVESLLRYEERAERFIESPALEVAAGMMAEDGTPVMAGRRISHYKIISSLGAGGMGEVYLAEDTALGRKVALKLLPALFTEDPDRLRRFAQEARAASALSHPNVAHVYEIGEADGTSFIAMEYVEGQLLEDKIGDCPLDTNEIVDIAVQTADALDAAHAEGIIHRDIKPANIVITPRGQVKVLDFGLAKVTARQSHVPQSEAPTKIKTSAGLVMGTVPYMSPEQALGREIDTRTDIFSLGAVLYEMATGRQPFSGANAVEVIDHLAHSQPEAIARFNYDVPAELERIIRKCLEKDREHRYQSAREILVDLRNLQRDGGAQAVTTERAAPQQRSNRLRLAFAALAVTILAVVGVERLIKYYTGNAEVYQLQFKGDFYLGRGTEDDIKKGIEYFNRALAVEPNHAAAHMGLAGSYVMLSDWYVAPHEVMPKAQAAAMKALELDETAYPHVQLGLIKTLYEWDWVGAEKEFKRAIDLVPEDGLAHQFYGWYLIAMGRFDEARAEVKRSQELDPLNDFNTAGVGMSFYFARQYDQAVEQYRKAVGIEPKSHWSRLLLGLAYEQQGKLPEAIAELNQARRLNDSPQVLASLGHAYAVSGRRDEARAVIEELKETLKRKYVSPYDIATIYVGLGEKDEALRWLEKAYDDRSGWLGMWLKVDPKFDSLRSDPRFADLMRRVGHQR
ncbi:MAG: protein kinase [Pyrinomonadaceae bacterium]|nr:protein kinase [Pyrinomonadaceae bacterium]